MVNRSHASILSLTFWKAFWITMRPYLIFVSGSAGLVGLSFIENPETCRTILAFIPLFLSYGLGQALTDCFQMDTDALSSPYRPLIQGVISRKQVLIVSLLGLGAGVCVLGYLNHVILFFGILAVVGLLTYTFLKRTWWGGPPWNSWIVALLPIMGRLVDQTYLPINFIRLENAYSLSFLFAVLAVFFGYANFVIMGYFKDISADRKTGYCTFPVKFGWKPAAIYSDVTGVLAALFTGFALLMIGDFCVLGLCVFTLGLSINIYAQIKIHLTRDESQTHAPIANVVRAFILYCGAIIMTMKEVWAIPFVVFYVLFELNLKFRPEKTQV